MSFGTLARRMHVYWHVSTSNDKLACFLQVGTQAYCRVNRTGTQARWHVNHTDTQARWHVGTFGMRFSKPEKKIYETFDFCRQMMNAKLL